MALEKPRVRKQRGDSSGIPHKIGPIVLLMKVHGCIVGLPAENVHIISAFFAEKD
jgi:hypothetical protein